MRPVCYRCPICQQALQREDTSWRCSNNHSFDLAKEGYVNLLPVQHKHSKDPGDNAQMMQARRAFLAQGFYQPLSDKINLLFNQYLNPQPSLNKTLSFLDIGCGEGYYTERLANSYGANQAWLWGVDISKTAIRYAAKRYNTIEFSVASAYQLPFQDQCFDGLLRVYAPSLASELARVCKPGGYLLTVQPGAHHLFELKQQIYQTPRLHEEKAEPLEGFKKVEQHNLSYVIQPTEIQARLDLINMTPFCWKLDEDKKRLVSQTLDEITLDFVLTLYQRH